jgi:hypothetical protein
VSAPIGYEAVRQLTQELGRPASTLTVLAFDADPFVCGSPRHVASAEWFAALWQQHMNAGGHLRRLHYRLVSQAAPINMVSGAPYENTMHCWTTLKLAGKWARYLGLIDADDLEDRRNPRPHIWLQEAAVIEQPTIEVSEPEYFWTKLDVSAPELPDPPQLTLRRPPHPLLPQRYHLEIWVEKSDVEDVVLPIARTYGLNYHPFAGQPGIKACRQLVERAERSGRPARILYISDFDPQGESMPVAVARKTEFTLAERGLDLDIQVIPIALTKQQCMDLKLPRIPIKDSDRGKRTFEERHGEGATELDALEAIHPGMLRQLILTEVHRYHDDTFSDRVEEAFNEALQTLSDDVDDLNESVVPRFEDDLAQLRDGRTEIEEALEPIRQQLKPILATVAAWRRQVERIYQAIADELEAEAPESGEIAWPEPAKGEEHPDPLFDSKRSYVDQIDIYKRHQQRPTEKRAYGSKHRKPNGEAAP